MLVRREEVETCGFTSNVDKVFSEVREGVGEDVAEDIPEDIAEDVAEDHSLLDHWFELLSLAALFEKGYNEHDH